MTQGSSNTVLADNVVYDITASTTAAG
ncbi:hypothetical protein [Mycolicibacterium rhodesiae]